MFDRRTFIRSGLTVAGATAAGGVLAACGEDPLGRDAFIAPDSDRVRAAEKARNGGKTVSARLTATTGQIDLGGTTVSTWTYGGRLPGAELRVTVGSVLDVTLENELPSDTSVHWHGLALRNDADGVPGVTQDPVAKGGTFGYRFTAPHSGTYWFHPHTGTQLDRGLYAPLIVEDPSEKVSYDDEWVVVLDDWMDGVTGTPDDVFAELSKGMAGMDHGGGHGGQAPSAAPTGSGGHALMGATSDLLGDDAGDVRYPYFLINGRVATAPETYQAKPGTTVRIRFINAGGDTAFRVALGGHRMTVTHTDGFPVKPFVTDALLLGMGERYDVTVKLGDGVFPLVALAEGKDAAARALVRTGGGTAPHAGVRPAELTRKVATYPDLRPTEEVALRRRNPDRVMIMNMTGGMAKYDWGLNGNKYDPNRIDPIAEGERIRIVLRNTTTMWHPMHLHGHTFAVEGPGIRKDTVIVLPKKTVRIDFDADNPGLWMAHCHNVYHGEAGMMTLLGYLKKKA